MVSVTRGEDQKPLAIAVSLAQPALGGGTGAGFDIFTSTSCFLLSSHPVLGNSSSFSPCFSSRVSAGRGLCTTSPGGRRRAGTSSRSDGRAGGCGGRRRSCRRKDLSRSLAKNKSSAPGVMGKCDSPGSRCYSHGDGWQGTVASQSPVGTATLGDRQGGGEPFRAPPPPTSYHRLHPLPSPPLPLPGISQLIPLAASLRHLQGLKTATVPALTPGDPLTSPAPSGCWRCPGAGWAPWPPPCMGVIVPHHPIPGGSWVLSPGHPIPSQLGQWGQMWGDPPSPLPPPCLPAGWVGG